MRASRATPMPLTVLGGFLGYDAARIGVLRERGVVAVPA